MSFIWVTTRFAAFHYWKDAPDEVAFLRSSHRHLFHVKAFWEVKHNDRDLEFFIQKRKLEEYVETHLKDKTFAASCEMLAEKILNALGCAYVDVSEDGENGAIVSGPLAVVEQKPQQCVTQVVKTKMFVGTEAEGPHRGAKVLFVPGAVGELSPDAVADVMAQVNPDRVYLGAGNSRSVVLSTVQLFCDFEKPVDIELEEQSFHLGSCVVKHVRMLPWSKNVNLIVCVRDEVYGNVKVANCLLSERQNTNVFFKRVDQERRLITWVCLKTYNAYFTSFDDSFFASDRDV